MKLDLPVWHGPDGSVVSCTEKVKVMTENMEELAQMAQDAFEDAILMGCDEHQVRAFLVSLMLQLDNPYQA